MATWKKPYGDSRKKYRTLACCWNYESVRPTKNPLPAGKSKKAKPKVVGVNISAASSYHPNSIDIPENFLYK
jgi:hypothetical protein